MTSGCPICAAYVAAAPQLGDKVMLLDGHRCGMVGTVSNTQPDPALGHGTFLIRADGEDPRYEQIVDPSLALHAPWSGSFMLPRWFPPFALRDCVEIHSVIVQFINNCLASNDGNWRRTSFNEIIRFCWAKRLPLQAEEVWSQLSAHGVPSSYEADATRLFSEGMELLIYANGRAPIKKRRLRMIKREDS